MLLFAGGDLRLVEVDGDFLTSSRGVLLGINCGVIQRQRVNLALGVVGL